MNWYIKISSGNTIYDEDITDYLSIGHDVHEKDKLYFIDSDFNIHLTSPFKYVNHYSWPEFTSTLHKLCQGRYDNEKKICSLTLNKANIEKIFNLDQSEYLNFKKYDQFMTKLYNMLENILYRKFDCRKIVRYSKNNNKIIKAQFKTVKGNPLKDLSYLSIGHDDNRGDALWFIDIDMNLHEITALDCYAHDFWPEFQSAQKRHEILASGRYDRKRKACSMALDYMSYELAATDNAIDKLKTEINNMLYKHYNCKKIYDYR